MAEENPLIEIKIPPKPINNTRELYFFENEKLILGRHGFIFKNYPNFPNNKERIKSNLIKQKELKELNRAINQKKIIKSNSLDYITKISKIPFSNKNINIDSQTLSQPIIQYNNIKNNSIDIEKIYDTTHKNVQSNENFSRLNQICGRQIRSNNYPNGIFLYAGGKLLNKRKINEIHSNSFNNRKKDKDSEQLFDIKNKNKNYSINITNRRNIYLTRIQRLNREAKKLKNNLHKKIQKTHFKGVESVFINPNQIYNAFKEKEYLDKQKKYGIYAYNENIPKKNIEINNEYKKDILDLVLEEKEKQNIIYNKDFSNCLNNKDVFFINNKTIIQKYTHKKEKENEDEKINKIRNMNYLKKLAFVPYDTNLNEETGNPNRNTENSSHDENRNKKKHEKKNEIIIGGKVFHLKNEIDKIAKEVLNKCKFYSYSTKNNKKNYFKE